MPMQQETNDAVGQIRQAVHGMWAAVASRWAEHADYIDRRAVALTERMLAAAAPRPGDRVLELASGPGGLGLAAAERVGLDGEVVVSDVVPEMASIAAARAAARGLGNVCATTLDLEHIDEPDERYDVVLCREGMMFAVQPDRAAREIHRVLRPGGRVAVSVWGPPSQNPWLSVVFDAVSAQLGRPVPPPGVPGPFSLADPEALRGLLTAAGLADVEVSEVAVPLHAPSFEAWWERTSSVAGPLAAVLVGLPDEAKSAIADRLRTAVDPYLTPEGLTLPGLALLAAGRRL